MGDRNIAEFRFINAYVVFYIITHTAFSEAMSVSGMESLKKDYGILLGMRSAIGLLLLSMFNMAFFFTNYFRFIATVGLAYLTNATLDVFTIFSFYLDLSGLSAAAIFYWLRPLSLAAILCCIISFDPER